MMKNQKKQEKKTRLKDKNFQSLVFLILTFDFIKSMEKVDGLSSWEKLKPTDSYKLYQKFQDSVECIGYSGNGKRFGIRHRWKSAIPVGTKIVAQSKDHPTNYVVYAGDGKCKEPNSLNLQSLSKWSEACKNQKGKISGPQSTYVVLKREDTIITVSVKLFDYVKLGMSGWQRVFHCFFFFAFFYIFRKNNWAASRRGRTSMGPTRIEFYSFRLE